jgi:hypothetical protein
VPIPVPTFSAPTSPQGRLPLVTPQERFASLITFRRQVDRLPNFAVHDVEDWKQPQRKEEGRGWAKAKATTADNTYTGPGGSKRD